MSAFEFLKQAREENPDVKFVLITAVEIKSAEFIKVLPSLHIDAFLDKQSLQDKLEPTISKLLGPRKLARSNIGKYR
jgi:two-component SAPR family response regulator